ncbi:TadE family type IV pilus minor pilin [Humidisolicoccus flavus]|uniref:TadE family type IV pilus minor pilin n=1 Tax=Humidisolicoccus flavus TaxID=3111414 RepID=UPI003248C61B
MHSRLVSSRGERGSASAELALALPAVGLVLAIALSALMAAGSLVRLNDQAADAARAVARGESAAPFISAGIQLSQETTESIVCVVLSETVFLGIVLSAKSCANEIGY